MWKLETSSDDSQPTNYENVRFRSQLSSAFIPLSARHVEILSAASFDDEGTEKFIGRMIMGHLMSTDTGFSVDGTLVKLNNDDPQRKFFVHLDYQKWDFEFVPDIEVGEEH